MNKYLEHFLYCILLLALFALHFVIGPWAVFFVAVALGFLMEAALWSFTATFISIFSFWTFYAYFLDFKSGFVLSGTIARIFSLPAFPLTYLMSALPGALVGGLLALTVFYLKEWAHKVLRA